MNHRETQTQIAIVKALRLILGKHYLIEHCPNHGFSNPGILTAMGMVPGSADLHISGAGFCARLEVKDELGEQKKKQEDYEADCKARGIPYAIARSVDEALATVVAWGIATRTRDGAVRCVPPGRVGAMGSAADSPERAGADDRQSLPGVPGETQGPEVGEVKNLAIPVIQSSGPGDRETDPRGLTTARDPQGGAHHG